jgi:endonuclease/exonuclease/phosphatase family metal-dependent hydrolase
MVQETGKKSTPKISKTGKFGLLFRAFTIVFSITALLSAYVSMFNPAKYWFIAITGLGFPILFAGNIFLLIIWGMRRRKLAFLPLAVFVLTLMKIPAIYQMDESRKKPDYIEGQSDELKVMSYNVRLFDLYNWTHNITTKEEIFRLLDRQKPDILCLQEFYSSEDKNFENEKRLREDLKAQYAHIEYPITLNKTDHWGIATYSSNPIINKGVLYFDKRTANICIFTDINLGTDTIRVYNCHLESVRFGAAEYKFIENLGNEQDDETVARTRNILKRLKIAFIKRAAQADMISKHIGTSPYPVIVCGDFNDTSLSYTYKTISAGLLDAFRESGCGMGSTYTGPIPGLRIDYILHSERFYSYDFEIPNSRLSDHFPILTHMVLQPK